MQIKVIGVSDGGGNAVNRMVVSEVQDVEFITVDTDKQALFRSKAMQKVQIGDKIAHGEGAGSKPEIEQKSGEESREVIVAVPRGNDIVFITASIGGGTGIDTDPIVAVIVRDMGILTIGIVAKPFNFEGKRHMKQVENGISALREHVDSLVVVPNERPRPAGEQRITLLNAFTIADDVPHQGVQSISDLIRLPDLVNLDFTDIYAVMEDASHVHMGVGRSSGKEKAQLVASITISSLLLGTSTSGAKDVITNITSSSGIGLDETETAASMIRGQAHEEANIIWSTVFDEPMEGETSVMVIATGFATHDDTPAQSISSAAVKTGVSAPGSSARPQQGYVEKTTGLDEDDTFTNIMSTFDR